MAQTVHLDAMMDRPIDISRLQPLARRPVTCLIAAFLLKLAKHMALIACLLIIGSTTGRTTIGPLAIFVLIVSAAILFSAARRLQVRSALPTPRRAER